MEILQDKARTLNDRFRFSQPDPKWDDNNPADLAAHINSDIARGIASAFAIEDRRFIVESCGVTTVHPNGNPREIGLWLTDREAFMKYGFRGPLAFASLTFTPIGTPGELEFGGPYEHDAKTIAPPDCDPEAFRVLMERWVLDHGDSSRTLAEFCGSSTDLRSFLTLYALRVYLHWLGASSQISTFDPK